MNNKLVIHLALAACLAFCTSHVGSMPTKDGDEHGHTEDHDEVPKEVCFEQMNSILGSVSVPPVVAKLEEHFRSLNRADLKDATLKQLLDDRTTEKDIVKAGFFKTDAELAATRDACIDLMGEVVTQNAKTDEKHCSSEEYNLFDLIDMVNGNEQTFEQELKSYPKLVDLLAFSQGCLLIFKNE